MLAATKPIKYSDSSEIVKNESTSAKEKQNPVFTSTSVIDLAEFNNERVLLKYLLPRKALARADWRTQLKEEVENLQTLQLIPDSNIVKIKGFIEDIVFERRNNNFPCIISEYFQDGNLLMYMEKNKDIPWSTRFNIALKIAKGLKVLHEHNIYHHDLKLTNILIRNNEQNQPEPYISDYGLAVVNDPCRANGIYAAPLFLSPVQLEELFLGSSNPTPYSATDDIYSFAYILYGLAYLKRPWESEIKEMSDASLICSILFENKRPLLKGKVLHPDFERLITQCWDKNASKRPTLDTIINTLNTLVQPEESFKSEVLGKFDTMPSNRELKIKEQELKRQFEERQKEQERKEIQKKAITKQARSNSIISNNNASTSPVLSNVQSPILTQETEEKSPLSPTLKKESDTVSLKSSVSVASFRSTTPNNFNMENFEEEKKLANMKKEEERQKEKQKMEQEAMEKVLNGKKKREEQSRLEKTKKEQEYLYKEQEDQERFKIREALLKQLELRKEEEAKKRELEKIELTKQKEKEAFEKIEKAKNILLEKEKEKKRKEQEEREKEMEKLEKIKEKWEIQKQKTAELEKKKEEERLKREQEKQMQIKSEEQENFQKTLKAKELELKKEQQKREEELKKSTEQEEIIAKQWKIQQEKLKEFEKKKEEAKLIEKKKREEEEKKREQEAMNKVLIAKKKLEEQQRGKKVIVDKENENILNLLKSNDKDRSAILEFEKKRQEKLKEKEKEHQMNIAKDEDVAFRKAIITKKKFEEKDMQRRKEEQLRKEMEMKREKERAERWKIQKKKFEALEEERRRIRESNVNQDSIIMQFTSGRTSPTSSSSSVSSRVNFFRQKMESETNSEHGSPPLRSVSPYLRSISPIQLSPQLRASSPTFYRPSSPSFRASSPTPSVSSVSSVTSTSSSSLAYGGTNGQYVYKLRNTNIKDFEKRKQEAQREQERVRREMQKQQEQEAFKKLLNAKKKINEIEAKKKLEEEEKRKLNQNGLAGPRSTSRSTSRASISRPQKEE